MIWGLLLAVAVVFGIVGFAFPALWVVAAAALIAAFVLMVFEGVGRAAKPDSAAEPPGAEDRRPRVQ